jgi:hypothetical protein
MSEPAPLEHELADAIAVAQRLVTADDSGSAETLTPVLAGLAGRLSTVDSQRQVDDVCYLAAQAWYLGRRAAAVRLLDELTRVDRPDVGLASAHNLRGVFAMDAGDNDAAVSAFRRAADAVGDGTAAEVLNAVTANAAVALWRNGDVAAAALQVAQARARQPADPRIRWALALTGMKIAAARADPEQVAENLALARTATGEVLQRFGPRDPRSVAVLVGLATVEADRVGAPTGVDAAVEQVAQVAGGALGHDHPGVAVLRVNQAVGGLERARTGGSATDVRVAVDALRRATRHLNAGLGGDHPEALAATANLAAADLELARMDGSIDRVGAAADALAAVEERIVDRYGPAHPRAVAVRDNLAAARSELAHLEGVAPVLRRGDLRLQPRRDLLNIWRAITAQTPSALDPPAPGHWSDSLSDAARLLCIMSPATHLETFQIDDPDRISADVLAALGAAEPEQITARLVAALLAFVRRYADADGTPLFSAPTHLRSTDPGRQPTSQQRDADMVESFAASVTLCLATLGVVRVIQAGRRGTHTDEMATLERLTSIRLSAAMVGLLRSFVVAVFDEDSARGRALRQAANTEGLPKHELTRRLRDELRELTAQLPDLTLGIRAIAPRDLDHPGTLVEVGWSWGVTADAPPVTTTEPVGRQPAGTAGPPHLYFTNLAIDAINGLASQRTRILGLLTEEQQRLSNALQIRANLALSYWSATARLGGRRQPPETIPGATHNSLLLANMLDRERIYRHRAEPSPSDVDVVLNRAARTKPTRSLAIHSLRVELDGAEALGGPPLIRPVEDLSPMLLTRLLRTAGTVPDPSLRGRLMEQANRLWAHLAESVPPTQPSPPSAEPPSWQHLWQIVESLVAAAELVARPPLRSEQLTALVTELLAEADRLYDNRPTTNADLRSLRESLDTLHARLRHARQILRDRPGSALVIIQGVLDELNELDQVQDGNTRSS